MSLTESDPCQGNCTDCTMCDATESDTVPIKREDLQRILDISVCDDVRGIAWKYLSDKKY